MSDEEEEAAADAEEEEDEYNTWLGDYIRSAR